MTFEKFWESGRHMVESVISRLPSLILAIIVFLLFYALSVCVSRVIRRSTRRHRENLGMVFARLIGAAMILLGFLIAVSIVAPSFQAADLIKILGIGGVAIGFPSRTFSRTSSRACCCYGQNRFVAATRSKSTTTKEPWKTFKPEPRSSRPMTKGEWSSRMPTYSLIR